MKNQDDFEVVEEIQSFLAPIIRKYPRYLVVSAMKFYITRDSNKIDKVLNEFNFNKILKTKKIMPKKKSAKVEKVMHEFKEGTLHSGSKKGPKVTNPKQAIAISLSEARKAGAKIPKKGKK